MLRALGASPRKKNKLTAKLPLRGRTLRFANFELTERRQQLGRAVTSYARDTITYA